MKATPKTTRSVRATLEQMYGRRQQGPGGSGIEILVGTILSQNTSRANSTAGLARLTRRFGSFDAVADADTHAVAEAIRVSGLSNVKAPRIGAILRQVRRDAGRMDLSFLADWPVEEARQYLLGFDGVGPKTASCVLLFAFDKPVFPVDTHIRRIAERLGWVRQGCSPERAEELLTPRIHESDRHALHLLLVEHGRRTCGARSPRCAGCDLLDRCPAGQSRRRQGLLEPA